ncbi:unnamed protein product [Closterium sp. NIES-54]
MVQQVLQRFGFTYSSPQATPLSTRHSLSALPLDESVESSGPYPELVSCLMYLMTCTRPDLAYPLSILARYVAPGRHRPEHMAAAKRVLRYLCSTSGMGLVLGGRSPVVLTGHADASWADDQATQRSSQGYTFSLGSGSVSWRSTRSSSVLGSSCEAEIYAGAMAAQELRWLTYLLTDLGEPPRSPPVLYVDNKGMLALCQEHRLEHKTKHIALRYFLARELQQRGQLRLAYVASEANTADIFTKALAPCDHQRFCTLLAAASRAAASAAAAVAAVAAAYFAACIARVFRVRFTGLCACTITTSLAGHLFFAPLHSSTRAGQSGSYFSMEMVIRSPSFASLRLPRSQLLMTFCLPARRLASRVPPFPACAPLCPARVPPCLALPACCLAGHCPALLARRPANRHPALASRRPALLVASHCPARRVALPAVASPCLVSRVALLPARRIAACASPCPARAKPPCRPHHPAARRPAARAALLLPALLAGALLLACRPAGSRTALPATPCCAPPCWTAPCCPHNLAARRPAARAALLLPALLHAALLVGALLPVCRPAGSRTAARTALPAPPCSCPPRCVPPYWLLPCPALAARHSSLAVRRLSLPCAPP